MQNILSDTSFAVGNKVAKDQTTLLIGKGDLCLPLSPPRALR